MMSPIDICLKCVLSLKIYRNVPKIMCLWIKLLWFVYVIFHTISEANYSHQIDIMQHTLDYVKWNCMSHALLFCYVVDHWGRPWIVHLCESRHQWPELPNRTYQNVLCWTKKIMVMVNYKKSPTKLRYIRESIMGGRRLCLICPLFTTCRQWHHWLWWTRCSPHSSLTLARLELTTHQNVAH